MYATDTRIGRGIMTPRIGCRLSLLRYHAAGEGASLFPVGAGEALRCLLPRTAGKGVALFSAHWALWFYSRKTSHREVFLGCAKWKFAGNFFSYKKFPKPQDNLSCGFSLQKALER